MKKIIIEVLFGLVIIIVMMILELLVMLPFTGSDGKDMNLEFWLTALPAGIVTFLSAHLLRTASKREAVRKGCIWCGMVLLWYLLIGLLNDNLAVILSKSGFYAMLILALIGPFVYAIVHKLPTAR